MQIKKTIAALTAAALIGCNSMLTPFAFTAPPSILAKAEEQAEVTIGDLTFTKYEDHAEVSKCAETAATAVIPAEVEGLPVTSIGTNAFRLCGDLKEITIPDSVTSIESEAFASCYSLTSITIPDGVTSISDYTFARCYSLTDVTIPDGVTSIGEAAFTGCRSLTAITLPESVTSIGQEALYNECASLTAVTILNPDCEIYDDAKTINEVSAIRGHNGSTAQTYAEKYGRTFESLDAEQPTENTLGDLNNDTSINASDAALVLIAAAKLGATGESGLTAAQEAAADVNGDKLINASDAAIILQYAATVGAGSTDTLAEFLEKRKQ